MNARTRRAAGATLVVALFLLAVLLVPLLVGAVGVASPPGAPEEQPEVLEVNVVEVPMPSPPPEASEAEPEPEPPVPEEEPPAAQEEAASGAGPGEGERIVAEMEWPAEHVAEGTLRQLVAGSREWALVRVTDDRVAVVAGASYESLALDWSFPAPGQGGSLYLVPTRGLRDRLVAGVKRQVAGTPVRVLTRVDYGAGGGLRWRATAAIVPGKGRVAVSVAISRAGT